MEQIWQLLLIKNYNILYITASFNIFLKKSKNKNNNNTKGSALVLNKWYRN